MSTTIRGGNCDRKTSSDNGRRVRSNYRSSGNGGGGRKCRLFAALCVFICNRMLRKRKRKPHQRHQHNQGSRGLRYRTGYECVPRYLAGTSNRRRRRRLLRLQLEGSPVTHLKLQCEHSEEKAVELAGRARHRCVVHPCRPVLPQQRDDNRGCHFRHFGRNHSTRSVGPEMVDSTIRSQTLTR